MNLSTWAQYDQEETVHLLEEMCELVEAGEMPLLPYLWMHEESHMDEKEIRNLCEWTQDQLKQLRLDAQGE